MSKTHTTQALTSESAPPETAAPTVQRFFGEDSWLGGVTSGIGGLLGDAGIGQPLAASPGLGGMLSGLASGFGGMLGDAGIGQPFMPISNPGGVLDTVSDWGSSAAQTAGQAWNAFSSTAIKSKPAGLFNTIGGAVGDIVGLGGNITEGLMRLGGAAQAAESASGAFGALGGITGGLSLLTGAQTLLNDDKSLIDRAVGGVNVFSGGLGALHALAPSLGLAPGGTAGLTATIGSGTATATTAATLGTAGAVAGAGAAGWGIGSLIAENTRVGDSATGIVGGIDSALTGGLNMLGVGDGRSAMLQAAEMVEEHPYLSAGLGMAAAPLLAPLALGGITAVGGGALLHGAGSAALDYGGRAVSGLGNLAGGAWDTLSNLF